MDKIEKSKTYQIGENTFVIRMKRAISSDLYVCLELKNDSLAHPIELNLSSKQLEEILTKLHDYQDDIKRIQLNENEIKPEDVQPIITTFLKGITIKDLSLQFRYKEKDIKALLIKHNIEIIEGLKPQYKYYRR
jgi:hypothetical protein